MGRELRGVALGIVQPLEQAAHVVGMQQGVEEGRAQRRLLAQVGQRLVGQLEQRALHRLARGRIRAHGDAQAVGRLQEAGDGPVAAVLVGEDNAAILQLGQELEWLGAFLHRSQLLAADAGQVDDGYTTTGWRLVVENTGDCAAQIDGRAGAAVRVVVAQGQQGQPQAQRRQRARQEDRQVLAPVRRRGRERRRCQPLQRRQPFLRHIQPGARGHQQLDLSRRGDLAPGR